MLSQAEAATILSNHIREAGYKALVIDEHHVQSFMSGFVVLVFVSPAVNNIQFYSSFSEKAGEHFSYKHANAFNEVWRYAKCLIRDSGTVAFEADFMVWLERDDAAAVISSIIGVFETTLNAGAKALVEASAH